MNAPTGDPAAAREWRAAFDRVTALVRDADPEALQRPVPATPDWTGTDLLAHMVGLDADVLRGDEPDDHNPTWTQAQVDTRAGHDAEQMLAEWAALADDVEHYISTRDPRPLGDAIIHEQDLRGALLSPGARDTAGLALIRHTIADRIGGAVRDADLPALRLEAEAEGDQEPWQWQSSDGEPGVLLAGSGFEIFRAITSRRSEAQLRGMVVRGDVDPYLGHLAALGPLPDAALPE